jgi:hypothetical protein
MIFQPEIIKLWLHSKNAMERECAQILPACRVYDISSVNYYTQTCMKWNLGNIVDMKGLCINLPYRACNFEFNSDVPLKDRIEHYDQFGEDHMRMGAIVAYAERQVRTIKTGSPVDWVDQAMAGKIHDVGLVAYSFLHTPDGRVKSVLLHGMLYIPVNENGEICGQLEVKLPYTNTPDLIHNKKDQSHGYHLMQSMVPVLYAISLLTCKNVRTAVRVESKPRTARERSLGHPEHKDRKFHVLDVPLITKLYETKSTLGPKGKSGLHTVGGHFKTYTEDAPLLGKHVGRWWWGILSEAPLRME